MPYTTRKTQGYSFREYLQGASRWNCRSVWEIANRIRRSQDHQGWKAWPGVPSPSPAASRFGHSVRRPAMLWPSPRMEVAQASGPTPATTEPPWQGWGFLPHVQSRSPLLQRVTTASRPSTLRSEREPGPLLPINPHWVVEDCTEILPRALGRAQLRPTDWEQHQGRGLPQLTKKAHTAARKKGGGRRDRDNSFALMVHICPALRCSSLVAEQQ